MMSSAATSSPVSASTLAYLMRWPVLRLIWLKLTFSVSDVAGYRATGQVTSERRKKPFQCARGAMGYSEYAANDRPRYHRGTRIQGEREGNLSLALTGLGPVGCKRTLSATASPGAATGIRGARMSPERNPRRLSARQFESQKSARQPAVRLPGSLGGNAQRGLRTATRRTMVAQCSPSAAEPEGPRIASPNSMRRKPSHPDAEGIADDGGDENGKHQRPAAKVAIEVPRMPLAFNPPPTILLASSPVRSFRCRTSCTDRRSCLSRNTAPAGHH